MTPAKLSDHRTHGRHEGGNLNPHQHIAKHAVCRIARARRKVVQGAENSHHQRQAKSNQPHQKMHDQAVGIVSCLVQRLAQRDQPGLGRSTKLCIL